MALYAFQRGISIVCVGVYCVSHNSRFALAVLAIMAVPVAAHSATVQPLSGGVFVNQGAGFKPVGGPTKVSVGDRVITRNGGSAEIIYDDGCRMRVETGSITTIGGAAGAGSLKDHLTEASPCAANANAGSMGSSGASSASAAGAAPSYALEAGAIAAGVGAIIIIKKLSASP